jgi:hypothetical protein
MNTHLAFLGKRRKGKIDMKALVMVIKFFTVTP